jgi:hypothetical protein
MVAVVAGQYLTFSWCLAHGSKPSDISGLVVYVVLLTLTARWLGDDRKNRGITKVWDSGFFLLIAWPVVVPYYLAKTRGTRKAALIVLAAAAVYLAAILPAMILYLVLNLY